VTSGRNGGLKLLKGGGRPTPRRDPVSNRRSEVVALMASDFLADLTRFAPDLALIRASNTVGTGPKVETRPRALERIRRALLSTTNSESWALAIRSVVDSFTLVHVLRPWLRSHLNSPRDRAEAVEGLVGWYKHIIDGLAENQAIDDWLKPDESETPPK
jgi:hypothetical protein